MNDEQKTVAQLLREQGVYQATGAKDPDPRWKEALLTELDLDAAVPAARPVVVTDESAPLRWRHLGLMAPLGAALFMAGYWFGREGTSLGELARVHPMVWVAAAVGMAAATLSVRGISVFRR